MDKENILRHGGGYEDVREKDAALGALQSVWVYLQKRRQLRIDALGGLGDDILDAFLDEFESDRQAIRQIGSSISFD